VRPVPPLALSALFFIKNVISRSSNPGVIADFSENPISELFSSGKLVKNCGRHHALTITMRSQMPAHRVLFFIILPNPLYAQQFNGLFTTTTSMNQKNAAQQNISLFKFRIAFNRNKKSAKQTNSNVNTA
jgi:hypothetical protein